MAMSFEEAVEMPHFEKTSFRVNNKIFATLDVKNKRVAVKFTPVGQSVFCAFDKMVIYPVPGGWGRMGYTLIELKKVKKEMLLDALTTSYCILAPKRLASKYSK